MQRLMCGRTPCAEHGAMCAFHGDEPDRCPWCHSSWTAIIATGWHSCERAEQWPSNERATRLAEASRMRLEATQKPSELDTTDFCPHLAGGEQDDDLRSSVQLPQVHGTGSALWEPRSAEEKPPRGQAALWYEDVRSDISVPPSGVDVARQLARLCGDDSKVRVTRRSLADAVGKTNKAGRLRSYTDRGVKALEDTGWVMVEVTGRGRGAATTFYLMPGESATDVAVPQASGSAGLDKLAG